MRSTYKQFVWRAARPVNMVDCMTEWRYFLKYNRNISIKLHFKKYLPSFIQSAMFTGRVARFYILRVIVKLAYRPCAWWRFADQFTPKPHIQNAKCSQRTGIEKNTDQHEMWKKRAETTWERGVVVKLISKTSSCLRSIRGVSHGFGIDVKKKMRKKNEMARKSSNWCLNMKSKSSCYQSKFAITIILVDFYKCMQYWVFLHWSVNFVELRARPH